jgi:hypothetical protein
VLGGATAPATSRARIDSMNTLARPSADGSRSETPLAPLPVSLAIFGIYGHGNICMTEIMAMSRLCAAPHLKHPLLAACRFFGPSRLRIIKVLSSGGSSVF